MGPKCQRVSDIIVMQISYFFSNYFSPGKPCLASLELFMLILLPVTDLSENKDTQEAIELSTGLSKH